MAEPTCAVDHDEMVPGAAVVIESIEDGRNSCPPEDCGGPLGDEEFLQAIADQAHPRHKELTEWSPLDFDAAHFDPTEATADMQSPRPLYGW